MDQKGINWHTLTSQAVIQQLKTDFEKGIGTEEAQKRLIDNGRNALPTGKRKTILGMFIDQFKDFLILILVAAAVISGLLGETTDATVIIVILIINAVLGVSQERKASKALDALKKMSVPECDVIRDGSLQKISSEELVPGDIILLHEGDYIPADLRLIEAYNLRVDEASLTGESVPVEKVIEPVADDLPIADRINMAYSGTIVAYGRAKGVVTETGLNREIGKIAQLLEKEEEVITPLQKRLAGLGKLLGYLTLIVCGVVFVVGIIRGEQTFDMFMTAVSLAVAAIPEGLPAIVTIVLALGVTRMSQRNAIIRKLPAVETLGSATVICTDKTGTLTQNQMTVQEVFQMNDEEKEAQVQAFLPSEVLIKIGVLCNDSSIAKDNGKVQRFGDPTELALVELAEKNGYSAEKIRQDFPRLDEVPFDSKRKMMSTLHEFNGKKRILVKGAPDVLINRCSSYQEGDQKHPLGEEEKQLILSTIEEMAGKALRVLAFAEKEMPDKKKISQEDEVDLNFYGLVGMIDPPRPEVRQALEEANSAGIETIMITGDNLLTAKTIAQDLGLLQSGDEAITGQEMEKLSQETLMEKIKQLRVFARVWPEQKLNIVEALQKNHEVVAMTGDGVNDAPALKKADIGVAMGITGTDVAKEVADVVLMDDNFATIVKAIEEGRVIFDNIRKFVMYLLACNIGEIFAIFIPILIGLHRPLVPVQILLINLVTDGLPAMALGVDSPEPDIMMRKPRNPKEGILNPQSMKIILFNSVFIAISVIIAFVTGTSMGGIETGRTMAFVTLAFSELLRAYSFRSEKRNFWQINLRSNLYLIEAALLSAAIVLITVIVPSAARVFSNVQLNGLEWMYTIIFSFISFFAYEIWKIWDKNRHP
ncbi:calcium-translocating P-type ATPase, SERCA-type [Atribacter laminatus]|uniref:P-type Ca(2+) transporter n=1 Tax=Atribacter laminatus TaxID=2847778 RepID=A0A7T1AMQ8_ATRLM|nr:calcium-translocating P-type ATPase, SERCA-type [Atribacter laminatus]QPM68759.1 Calcium-transporting ATPase 1 [Atribacter laminatus]